MTKHKVFLSSTCKDLTDLRAEVADSLTRAGLVVFHSEHPSFAPLMNIPAADLCLTKVNDSDSYLLIVDMRYGSLYDGHNMKHRGISVTHAEFRTALEREIPIVIYVRQAVKIEHAIWKKNGQFLDAEEGVLKFLTEIEESKLWQQQTFTDVTDLKVQILKRFKEFFVREADEPPIQEDLAYSANPRFGFRFYYPIGWERIDPDNGDGNRFYYPKDPRVSITASAGFSLSSEEDDAYDIERYCKSEPGYKLIYRVSSGREVIDFKTGFFGRITTTIEPISGEKIKYEFLKDGLATTAIMLQTHYDGVQFTMYAEAPSDVFSRYEDLFIAVIARFKVIGKMSAPLAR